MNTTLRFQSGLQSVGIRSMDSYAVQDSGQHCSDAETEKSPKLVVGAWLAILLPGKRL